MEIRRDAFHAIADPTRREIINMIAHRSLNLNTLANNFKTTRQAISLHLKVLAECGLVVINQKGRERYCEPRLERLNEVAVWVAQYKLFWEGKPDSPELYLDKGQKTRKSPLGK